MKNPSLAIAGTAANFVDDRVTPFDRIDNVTHRDALWYGGTRVSFRETNPKIALR
jgi:hypothetical protein